MESEPISEPCNDKDTDHSIDLQCDIKNLSSFNIKRILRNLPQSKTIFIEGSFTTNNEEKAVLILEKRAFDESSLSDLTASCELEKSYVNDIYGSYESHPLSKYNSVKTTLIYPATDQHIKKFESQPVHVIEETKDLYYNITLPHVESNQLSLDWVYNILEHKSEVERIVLEDEDPDSGFVLLPDLKWDGKQKDTLYLLAIVRPRNIRSIRDLTEKHLPLLTNVRDKATKLIEEKYGIRKSQIRAYFHYQPSFYHLHVHFTYLQYEAPGIHAERAHLLSGVIGNILLKPNYYQEASLTFTVRESDKLFSCFEEKVVLFQVLFNEFLPLFKMKHPSLVIEIRPRLQTCQVFYHLKSSENNNLYSIVVQPSSLTVKCDSFEDKFMFRNVKLKTMLLTSLKADEENVLACRLQIESAEDDIANTKNCKKYVPNVDKDTPIQILCRFCSAGLMKRETPFDRVLPLPSSGFSSSDFFCHECSGHDFENKHKAEPKLCDLLYGNYYFKINCDLLCDTSAFTVKDIVHCQQCRTCVGSKDKVSATLWNCTVKFSSQVDSKTTPKNDFVAAIRSVVEDSVSSTCKIIVSRKTTSSSCDEFILIWVMDKSLPLLVSHNGSDNLRRKSAMKLLFSHEKSHSPIVEEWEKDISVHSTDVAEIMFTEGLDCLELSNLIYPKAFRHANDMNVGYLADD